MRVGSAYAVIEFKNEMIFSAFMESFEKVMKFNYVVCDEMNDVIVLFHG